MPAIMASRGLENKRDRYKVMLVTPFMSCNARLTIYILFSEIFFNEYAMVAAYSMYIIGIFVAIGVSLLIHWTDVARHLDKEDYLLIELPEYKMPDMRTVGIYVSDKVKGYLQRVYGRSDTKSGSSLRTLPGASFCSYWTGILADYGGPSCRNFSKRSGCIKLCRSFWNHQCNKRRGHGPVSAGS